MRTTVTLLVLAAMLAGTRSAWAETSELAPWITALRAVDREGKGHREATEAWARLTTQAKAEELPVILAGMDGANPLAANWLRAAADAVAERNVTDKGNLPLAPLQKFLAETEHNPRARRQAYEWIIRQDPNEKKRLMPTLLNDPSLELRRDAVAELLTAANEALKSDNPGGAVTIYRATLQSARDLDQVKVVTDGLKKLGEPVDLPRHYGFLMDWKLVGPFDNRQGKGFDTVYPPETALDVTATYSTPDGVLAWKPHHTEDEYGFVDLNKAIGKHMGVAAYAVAEFQSDGPQTVEIRLGSENANKVWLNGRPLMSAEVYHANGTMDQYVAPAELKDGRNVILLKICQDEQTVDWAQNWTFQLRICDASGKAILSTDRPPSKPAEPIIKAQDKPEKP